MRRHSFVARFGQVDRSRVDNIQKGSKVTKVNFLDPQGVVKFGLDDMVRQLSNKGLRPSHLSIDLVVLAALVKAADDGLLRKTESQDGWTREINLYVPVSDVNIWGEAAAPLKRMLNFLTGDRWDIFFRPQTSDYEQIFELPNNLALDTPFDCVCLFSGGLDSFIGAADLLKSGNTPLLVSHYLDLSTHCQNLCVNRLTSEYTDADIAHVRVRVGFTKNDFDKETEPTQRSRSFLFFALAAAAASGMGGPMTIFVPENGLISLNVPLDPLRVGAWSTKTTHPFYMARWNELLGHLNIGAVLENPYRFMTKGEMMLPHAADQGVVRRRAHETISCSSVSKARYLGKKPGHCGYCVPCLIRRAAFKKALGRDSTSYTYTLGDLTGRVLNAEKAEGGHIRSLQLMADRLNGDPRLARSLIHKSGPLSDHPPDDWNGYAGVFQRGIEEVHDLIRNMRVRGKWT